MLTKTNIIPWWEYESIKKSITKFIYIHLVIENWMSQEDRAHDFTTKLLINYHLVDKKKQSPTAKPENLVNNWAISNTRWWQTTLKNNYYKEAHPNKFWIEEDDFLEYSNLENDNMIDNVIEYNNEILNLKLLVDNNSEFHKYDKLIFEELYLNDTNISLLWDKIWKSTAQMKKIHKEFIIKLKKYENYLIN